MSHQTHSADNPNTVISYLQLRQLIGVLGISLPFVLVIGSKLLADCSEIQPSISHYYYSIMHILFVGVLCVLGGFLVTYRGKSAFENRVSNIAGAFAFCVAIFPTDFVGFKEPYKGACNFIGISFAKQLPEYVNYIHFGSAALLFTCFSIFCMKIFQESDEGVYDTKKKRRNRIYMTCGILIAISIASIAGIALYDRIAKVNFFPYNVIVFETTALLPFGFSWLLKGSLNWPRSGNRVVRKIISPLR